MRMEDSMIWPHCEPTQGCLIHWGSAWGSLVGGSLNSAPRIMEECSQIHDDKETGA